MPKASVNLFAKLAEREAAGRPSASALIGAGKFGTMFLTQVRRTPGMHLVGPRRSRCRARAQAACKRAGWDGGAICRGLARRRAQERARRIVTEDADALIACPDIEVIVEATGDPEDRHPLRARGDRARQAYRHGQCRSRCAGRPAAGAQGARGRRRLQPGLGRPAGADLRAGRLGARLRLQGDRAGKGTRYHPSYHRSNPDTVWEILDKYLRIDDRKSINPKMFNSFIDGTKSGIEMTAVCNATGLVPQTDGLAFPAGEPVRACRYLQAEERRRRAGEGRRHRSGVVGRSRRARRAASSRHGHFRGVRRRKRLRAAMFPRISPDARQERPLRRAVSADPHDRARARHLGRLGRRCAASRPARRPAFAPMWSRPPSAI